MMNDTKQETLSNYNYSEAELAQKHPALLRECLAILDRATLLKVINEVGCKMEADTPEGIIDETVVTILTKFAQFLDNITISEFEKILEMYQNHDKLLNPENSFKFYNFIISGFAFPFGTAELQSTNEYKLIIPREIAQMFMGWYSEDKLKEIEMRTQLDKTALSLAHLYGVYPKELLSQIWNKHYSESKFDDKMFDGLLTISSNYTGYVQREGYIMASFFADATVDADWRQLLELSKEKEYYIPTLEELQFYEDNEFDENEESYVNLDSFLKNKIKDDIKAANLMLMIVIGCVNDSQPGEFTEIINEAGVVFDSNDEARTMFGLLMKLSNNTRKWILKGYKPVELNPDISDDIRAFLDTPLTTSVGKQKVYPNDVCPCGSGKKYKKCCGKI